MLIYICALIAVIMIAISCSPLNDRRANNINDYLFVFFWHLYGSFKRRRTKYPSAFQTLDSSFNTTFISLSICHDCFSFTHFNLIFFSWCIRAVFCLAFLYVNPILFRRFLTVLSHKLTSVLTVFRMFCCTFSFFNKYCFEFSIRMLSSCLSWFTNMFFFVTTPFLLYLLHILHASDWRQPTVFSTLHWGFVSGLRFFILSTVSINISIWYTQPLVEVRNNCLFIVDLRFVFFWYSFYTFQNHPIIFLNIGFGQILLCMDWKNYVIDLNNLILLV